MSEKPDTSAPVQSTSASVQSGISVIASAHAPFLYFEDATTFGHLNGIIKIGLEASIEIPISPTSLSHERVIVAHLRMNVPGALSLKAAIENALLLAAPAGGAQPAPRPN